MTSTNIANQTKTKQEEIREGIKAIILPSGKESVITPYMSGIVAQLIVEYLHSQGVVIKVELWLW